MSVYEVNLSVFVSADSQDEAIEKAITGDIACYNIHDASIPACVSSKIEVTFANADGQHKVVYHKQDEGWIIKEGPDDVMPMGQSEHHYLDDSFYAELMFEDFKGKSWSDGKDEVDEQTAKQEWDNFPF